ncbi:hypothetical protein P5673_019757 [Acropora cervicornis]|uniref:Uncharacterized protein n=1 Tax=Acropora cervicornis TaxID=6130 RepID=A0AAD9QAT9_ACRCE|nr:hypothetical protein P5673_019757 [Acropora cervicornis]
MIITGKDQQEHLVHLEESEVLKRLKEHDLREKITYCGHVVDQDGLHETQEKVDVIVHALRPETFDRLVNYYHKFLLNPVTVPHLLNQLLEQSNQ